MCVCVCVLLPFPAFLLRSTAANKEETENESRNLIRCLLGFREYSTPTSGSG